METQMGFILKLLILSTILSAVIKYGGPLIPIIPTPFLALTIVFLPTAIVAVALWQRRRQQSQHQP